MTASKQPKRTPRPGVDGYGRTPLHNAAADANIDLVRALLEAGADPNAADDNQWTPLHFAAQCSSAPITSALLTAGAHVNARDNNGNTPLFTAVFNSRGEGSVIELLRQAGADPCLANDYGISAVSLARGISNFHVAQYFQDLP